MFIRDIYAMVGMAPIDGPLLTGTAVVTAAIYASNKPYRLTGDGPDNLRAVGGFRGLFGLIDPP